MKLRLEKKFKAIKEALGVTALQIRSKKTVRDGLAVWVEIMENKKKKYSFAITLKRPKQVKTKKMSDEEFSKIDCLIDDEFALLMLNEAIRRLWNKETQWTI